MKKKKQYNQQNNVISKRDTIGQHFYGMVVIGTTLNCYELKMGERTSTQEDASNQK